jgi:hypothetical protein
MEEFPRKVWVSYFFEKFLKKLSSKKSFQKALTSYNCMFFAEKSSCLFIANFEILKRLNPKLW